ncbi:pyruvate dehydrogenase X component [Schizosaccharomyces japonicus yFS275]|uniref:Pyruvate dehydrogenase X component n=1 Tax=Schizosaccharomyces japonicus (strain yFS275 / FY16936) TaxID=402676 RepID=B6JWU1_SCHJY|nr:pyruvate dehydrogenase X component [Schizosaccharomyces japonicus yFS275]EEB05842.2 pyruvate dehydrogenase X component [Schizosaccharomyces japonicus yFS275]
MGMGMLRSLNTIYSTCRHALLKNGKSFHSSTRLLAISKFNMPALSPTMETGTVAKWRLKEGDAYATGDVILEIETDKATMDVEAPDDGVLAKITVKEGQAVPVGAQIAIIADDAADLEGADLSKYESEDAAPKKKEESQKTEAKSAPATPVTAGARENSQVSAVAKESNAHIQFPSVHLLLKQNNVTDPSVIAPTGPHGILLKGDVLAYLGKISKQAPVDIEKVVHSMEVLDLSNVKPAAPAVANKPAAEETQKTEKKAAPKPELIPPSTVETTVNVQQLGALLDKLQGLSLQFPLQRVVEKACKNALERSNVYVPKSKILDDMFDFLVGSKSTAFAADSGKPLAFEPKLSAQKFVEKQSKGANKLVSALDGAIISMPSTIAKYASVGVAQPKAASTTTKDVADSSAQTIDSIYDFLFDTSSSTHSSSAANTTAQSQTPKDAVTVSITFDTEYVDAKRAQKFLDVFKSGLENPETVIF